MSSKINVLEEAYSRLYDTSFNTDDIFGKLMNANLGNTMSYPYQQFIYAYLPNLLSRAYKTPMKKRYEYRPDYVSYDYYGTVAYWYIILAVNKIPSIVKFNQSNLSMIYVPYERDIDDFIDDISTKQYPNTFTNNLT